MKRECCKFVASSRDANKYAVDTFDCVSACINCNTKKLQTLNYA